MDDFSNANEFLQPVVANCDWLSWSMVACQPPAEDMTMVRWSYGGVEFVAERGTATAVWNHRWLIYSYDDAVKVATMLMQPKSTLFRADAGLLEVANEWLYHGIGWEGVAAAVACKFGGQRVGLARWDYAWDFTPSDHQAYVIRALSDESMYVSGKRSGVRWWQMLGEAAPPQWQGNCPHCISWGHKTTAVRWKLYYKSLELAVTGMVAGDDGVKRPRWIAYDKPYIVDQWRAAGLVVENVWRVEVSVKHGNQLKADGMVLPSVFDAVAMNRVAGSLYRDRFIIKANQRHKDRTNDATIPFLFVGRGMFVRTVTHNDGEPRNARITLLRHLVKSLECPEVYLSDFHREWIISHVTALCEADNLIKYVSNMVGQDWFSYVEAVRCKSTT